jgi:radical SAM superfamily enzyme YgiQ (UPF0313 family)
MGRVILVSDNTSFSKIGGQRYIGPYAIAFALESAGFETVVVDYISHCENSIDYVKKLITPDTIAIGLSSTFMTPTFTKSEWHDFNSLTIQLERYSSSPILYREIEKCKSWLLELKDALNTVSPRGKILLGGAKTQFLLNFSREDLLGVDYFIWGAADAFIAEVVHQIESGLEPHHILINNHKVIDTQNHYKIIKSCPPFQWKRHWAIQPNEGLPIEVARGCIFNCKYCHYEKKESFKKEIEQLRLELIENFDKYGTHQYHFCDDCFNDNRLKVEAVCKMLIDLPFKVEWISYGRFDVAVKFPETVELMIKSGAKGIHWGIETLNGDVARQAGKGTPPEKIKKFLADFHEKYGDTCLTHGSFIMGLPGETSETQMETIDWITSTPYLDFITVGPLKIFPYRNSFDGHAMDFSDYSRNPEKFGFKRISFNPSDWEHSTMNRDQALEFAEIFNKKWRESSPRRRGAINTLWNYPHLRSLGYNEKQVKEIYFNLETSGKYFREASSRFQNRLEKYFKDLLELNGR